MGTRAQAVADDRTHDVTRILEAIRSGDAAQVDVLYQVVYAELKSMAAEVLRHEHGPGKASPSTLVSRVYLKLVGQGAGWESRAHFFGAAARAMRQILIEDARHRDSQKRGGRWKQVVLPEVAASDGRSDRVDLLSLDGALKDLAELDPDGVRLVELRYFAGMTNREVGQALGVDESTVRNRWDDLRTWLWMRINGAPER